MYPNPTDVISRAPRQLRRAELPITLMPAPRREIVFLGQAAGRGPWFSGTVNATSTEASQVIRELNSRRVFGDSQAPTVSPEEALKWGVDFALYRLDPKRQEGYDRLRPFVGSIKYTTHQYLTDRQFIGKARYAIAAARRVVGSAKSTAKPPHTASMPGVQMNLPRVYEDVIKAAMGLA